MYPVIPEELCEKLGLEIKENGTAHIANGKSIPCQVTEWELRIISFTVFSISLFAHVYPGINVTASTFIVMLLISAVFAGLGLIGFAKRDIVWE